VEIPAGGFGKPIRARTRPEGWLRKRLGVVGVTAWLDGILGPPPGPRASCSQDKSGRDARGPRRGAARPQPDPRIVPTYRNAIKKGRSSTSGRKCRRQKPYGSGSLDGVVDAAGADSSREIVRSAWLP
jgi:hypothetical protein